MRASHRGDPMPVGYLNTEYPSVSHTFIEREIRAVRASGVDVVPYSIRIPADGLVRGDAAVAARSETKYVLAGWPAVAGSIVRAAVRHPAGVVRAVRESQRMALGGFGDRLRHLAYAVEAMRLAELLRADGVRHVHVHMANNGAAVAMLACLVDRSLEYSLTIHGSAEFFDVHRVQLARKAERAVFVRCISDFCRAQVMIWTDPAAWSRFRVIPTGLDPEAFSSPASRDSAEGGELRVLAIGRLHAIKGYLLLIEAVAEVVQSGLDISLDLVGDGPQRAAIERRIRELGIVDRVRLHGARPVEDIPGLVSEADLLVVSSFMEGVPTVLMEAMAAGCLVLSTRVGGVAELVDDRESSRSGFLVDAGSVQALADGLRAVAATHPEQRREIRRRARQTVLERYDIRRNGAAVAELLRSRG